MLLQNQRFISVLSSLSAFYFLSTCTCILVTIHVWGSENFRISSSDSVVYFFNACLGRNPGELQH